MNLQSAHNVWTPSENWRLLSANLYIHIQLEKALFLACADFDPDWDCPAGYDPYMALDWKDFL